MPRSHTVIPANGPPREQSTQRTPGSSAALVFIVGVVWAHGLRSWIPAYAGKTIGSAGRWVDEPMNLVVFSYGEKAFLFLPSVYDPGVSSRHPGERRDPARLWF